MQQLEVFEDVRSLPTDLAADLETGIGAHCPARV